MKPFRILGRSIRDSIKSIGRNIPLSIASISSILITLLIVAVALVLSLNVNSATKELENDLSIVVFIDNNTSKKDLEIVGEDIKGIDNVSKVEFKSKGDIKKEMMESSETFYNIMKDWPDNENPLQNIYTVKVKDAMKIKETANAISNLQNVKLVKYGEGMVEKLLTAFDGIKKAAFFAVIALLIVTLLLIVNTIKLTIFARKREISIMRLVGASNISIKIPYIFEGIILGILGSIIPILIVCYGYNWIYNTLDGKLLTDLINLVKPGDVIFKVSSIILLVAVSIGMVGSLGAVKKFLKV